MRLVSRPDGFDLEADGMVLLRHRRDDPCLYVGRGEARMDMVRGNFAIEDYVVERVGLAATIIEDRNKGWRVDFLDAGGRERVSLRIETFGTDAVLNFEAADPTIDRVWLRLVAVPGEHVWGGGEQMSYLDMAGRRFPMWTSEPGVGRDKSTLATWQADQLGGAGGDYYTTNYPQPTYLSSRHYALHVDTTAYSVFDFRRPAFHEIEIWAVPNRIELWARPTFVDLVTTLSERFGRQPPLPEWAIGGAIIGLKDGVRSFERLERYVEAGAIVTGLWCEDWAGVRTTSFGQRLFWDWQQSTTRYPDLAERIAALEGRGIRFLAYVNPYLCDDGALFKEAEPLGFFAKDAGGKTALVDFGEFLCGVVDFTRPDAADWFAERVIGRNLIDIGIAGWMADFGEYLPIDVHLANGDATLLHNAWPTLWAKVNADAIAARGKTGEIVFFMRAGFTGIGRYCPLLWAGDQSVDFSRHDGLQTVMCGALSSGLLGNAYHHSDIGGYTSLFGNVRTAELLMRWAEMAVFTPVMRTHEGNRPTDNLQIDQDADVLAHFSRMTQWHARLLPYVQTLVEEAQKTGLPLQRPLFLHFEDDPQTYAVQDAYLYGPDLLVAPLHRAAVTEWSVYLPRGSDWVHLWSKAQHEGGGMVTVAAPIGAPPVFYRAGSRHAGLFDELSAI